MNPEEKNMLLGAFATGLVDLALEAYYVYALPPRDQFPYMEVSPFLPPVDDLLACAGVPLGLYAMGRGTRRIGLVDMAKGAAVYGIAELVGQTIYRVVRESQAPGQFNISYEFPTTNIIRGVPRQASAWSMPQVPPGGHSGENLPFQTDMGH